MGIASGIELGCSYELGSGQTRIGVLTRPRKRSGTVMTPSTSITENPNKSLKINPFLKEPEIGCASELFQSTDDAVLVDFLQTPSREIFIVTCMVSCLQSPFLFADHMHFTRLSRVTNS